MRRPMQKLPSCMASPSASKTVPVGPALLPAWGAATAQASSNSDLVSSPSPALPHVSAQRWPLRPDPVTQPRRLSAVMKEKARQWLAGLPLDLPRPLGDSPGYSADRAPSIEPSPVGTARASLTGAFTLDSSHELLTLANGLSSTSTARAGGSILQRMRNTEQQQVDGSEGAETLMKNSAIAEVGDAPQRHTYLPRWVPEYDARSVPCPEDEGGRQRRGRTRVTVEKEDRSVKEARARWLITQGIQGP
ncbi:hypothetical protein C8Q72DRAFT_6218 [Fomitopsis betulina]|nr:hypothetical protein C8Q72DRAFT_6218 [Fomitopsis betulina]